MRKWTGLVGGVLLLTLAVLLGYGVEGFFSARSDAPLLSARADRLLAAQRGPSDLGKGRIDQLLLVEDPGFWKHSGVDLTTKGAGLTTLSQSLSKEVGFQNFRPGIQKVRLIGYAIGLESRLSKRQILALYLDTVWMGRGPEGPLRGFFRASQVAFGRPPADLSQQQFLTLVAVPIAPRTMSLTASGPALVQRTGRIQRLVEGKCRHNGLRDVWLEGCAAPQQALAN